MGETIDPIVLDSSVVSYIFNRDPIARYYVERMRGNRQYISFQTLEEAWYGAHSRGWGARRMQELTSHLERYEVIWPDTDLVEVCARLRAERRASGRELNMADAWIAATAIMLNCPLASHDSHFVEVPNLQLIRAPIP